MEDFFYKHLRFLFQTFAVLAFTVLFQTFAVSLSNISSSPFKHSQFLFPIKVETHKDPSNLSFTIQPILVHSLSTNGKN